MIFRLAFCLLLVPVFLCAQTGEMPYGKWEVVSAPDSLASPEMVRSINPYIGRKLVIKEKRFKSFFRRTGNPPITIKSASCKWPQYELSMQSSGQFLQYVGEPLLMFDRMAGEQIVVLSILCPGPSGDVGATIYLLRDDLLLLSYLGLNCYLKRK
ncbi:MAG: hypothetical protein KDC34_17285 [Saprospiraceae bacterium]|nr:hypothetical protein [Saprospiraceae bacterium]